MLVLKKIYSQPKLFDEVEFHSGINFIMGLYEKTKKDKRERGLNGVGKSTLIRLIDFALLSDESKARNFDVEKHDFLQGISIILEFEASNKQYIIKRSFENYNNPQFGNIITKLVEYNINDLRKTLGSIFFGQHNYSGYYDNLWFRTLIRFFIKDDLKEIKRNNPLEFATAYKTKFETYKFNLFLMNIPNIGLSNFIKSSDVKRDLETRKNSLIRSFEKVDGKNIDEIESEIQYIEVNIKKLEQSLITYKFLESYENVELELVNLSSLISLKLKDLNIFERVLNKYQRSYELKLEFDKEKVIKLYKSVENSIGKLVKKKLEEVLEFRNNLMKNRKHFIQDRELEIKDKIKKIKNEISIFEENRSKLYNILDEQEAFDSIKNNYLKLVDEKAKKERLLVGVSEVHSLNDEIIKEKKEIVNNVEKINEEIKIANKKLKSISSRFFNIVNEIIHLDHPKEAIFNLRSDVSEKSPLKFTVEIPKLKSLGELRLRNFVYDWTIFLGIIQNDLRYPHFLIHDGVFHAIDMKSKIRALNYVYSLSLKNPNFQYLITANQGDFFEGEEEEYGNIKFKFNDLTVATYKDNPPDMIFKRIF